MARSRAATRGTPRAASRARRTEPKPGDLPSGVAPTALEETAAYLSAKALGQPSPPPSTEAAAQAVAALLDAVLPSRFASDLAAAMRAATVAEDVTSALAGEPANLLRAEDVLRDATIRGEVQHRILQEPMLDAETVGALLGSNSDNRRQYASAQRQRGDLLAVPRRNAYLYPAFQFDRSRGCALDAAVRINRLLGAHEDPWGVASWWTTPSERLHNRKPKDLLGTSEEPLLLSLAEAELAPVG
jgi:hypothetical protein